ncbi:NAD-dependent epimerase/dehydratase family protein [Aquimarina sp. 2201CG5-10]|uniref:NAD-dependent epimerase/dehydratase family protein n=1 Tax=Aquimarina callyspongiae TaxID=3098150 RepID=UPI002AB4A657|nr:NAD-dependent epimerase/dehydratase family protein [Aquimarina sp. 2201CG5-10]MDY8134452.1 NAD-dependent epimerase/dehydratase family protein [Aquimarina sp. 2201CG5-10]
MDKREFIKTVGAASLFTFLNPLDAIGFTPGNIANKKVLILGGRGFLGPTIVKTFLTSGYDVTLLNRGKTNPHLFKNLPVIICDREKENKKGLKAIYKKHKDTYWDIVVDTWQKSPKAVSDFLEEFKGRFGHYHYISTISVYDKWDKKFITESEPLNPLPKFPKAISEDFRYAIRKTFAEEAIRERIDNFTIYRSHGMRGYRVTRPGDPDSEPFWPIRFYQGGEILLPNVENHHMQVTDTKSLSNFIVHCSITKNYGSYNVAYHPTAFKDYVSCLIHVTGKPEKMHWVDGDFLIKNGILPYKVMPLWRSQPTGSYYFNVQKAINAGFINRPMVEMITDQLDGYKNRYQKNDITISKMLCKDQEKCLYSEDIEKELIKKWLK